MNIGDSIKIALIKKKATQKDLAGQIGISEVTMTRIVNGGGCKQKHLEAMAKFFEMPVSEFIALGE